MKTAKLHIAYEYTFAVLGLVSAEKEYKLAWHLNKSLNINLVKKEDLKYEFLKGTNFFISNFIFETEYSTFRLLKNKSGEFYNTNKPFLLPEYKEYDYLVMLDGELVHETEQKFNHIKNIPFIQLASILNVEHLASKENLLF